MLAFGADAVSAAFYDFLITIIFEAMSIILFYVLIKTEYFNHYAGENSNEKVSLETLDRRDEDTENSSTTFQIYKKIWVWILAVFVTFATLMSVFPAITSQVVSTGSGPNGTEWNNKFFIPIGCFLLNHIGEFTGSTTAGFIKWPKNTAFGSFLILGLSVLRLVFIPLLLFCNIAPYQRKVTKVSLRFEYSQMQITFVYHHFFFNSIRCILNQTLCI